MLTILSLGSAVLTMLRPFEADLSQRMQVLVYCLKVMPQTWSCITWHLLI